MRIVKLVNDMFDENILENKIITYLNFKCRVGRDILKGKKFVQVTNIRPNVLMAVI